MNGEVLDSEGHVNVQIHRAFKVLLSIMFFFPLIGIGISVLLGRESFSVSLFTLLVTQLLLIRFVFIGFAFKILSNQSLQRLRDVLDIEWLPS